MAIYSLWMIEAEQRSGKWRRSATKRRRFLTMGPAGTMVETHRRLLKVLKRRAGSELEGVGVLLRAKEILAYFLTAANPDRRSVEWAAKLDEKRRFFMFAREE